MHSNSAKGFSIIEMLVSLSIFSVILLSLIYKQLENTQRINQQYYEQIGLSIIHNAYEQEFVEPEAQVDIEKMAAAFLPQGNGKIISSLERVDMEVSWFSVLSQQRKTVQLNA